MPHSKRPTPSPADPRPANTPVSSLIGLGPTSAAWLAPAHIHTLADLQRLGPVAAYQAVRATGARPTLNLLWALEGAITDLHWTLIPPARRNALRQELASSA